MPEQSTAKENPAAAVTPPIKTCMPWRVAAVEAHEGYRLHVRFNDGTEGTVDMARLVASPQAGVFAGLSDQSLFNKLYVEYGVVTWPGEIDLAPEAMYTEIKKTGEWVL